MFFIRSEKRLESCWSLFKPAWTVTLSLCAQGMTCVMQARLVPARAKCENAECDKQGRWRTRKGICHFSEQLGCAGEYKSDDQDQEWIRARPPSLDWAAALNSVCEGPGEGVQTSSPLHTMQRLHSFLIGGYKLCKVSDSGLWFTCMISGQHGDIWHTEFSLMRLDWWFKRGKKTACSVSVVAPCC